jgi:hypothetical protein
MNRTIAVFWISLTVALPALSAGEEVPADLQYDWQQRVQEAIEFVAGQDPDLARELMELRMRDPDAFTREIFHIMMEREELERLSRTDQQRYVRALKERELERKSHDLARDWHDATSDRKDPIKAELQNVLDELFDVRESQRSDQIVELEKELERLRETLKDRQAHKKAIVESRLKELLGEEDHLRW